MSRDDNAESPFAVLGIAPTLDLAAIKRAYFALLAKHPPHRDQEGFRRIRAAYEALGSFGEAAAFVLRHAPDPERELPAYRERHDAALASAREAAAAQMERAGASTRFAEGLLRLDLERLLARFAST